MWGHKSPCIRQACVPSFRLSFRRRRKKCSRPPNLLPPTDLVCLGPALLFQGQSWNLAGPGNAQHYPPRAIYSHPQHPRNRAPPIPKRSPENSNTAAPTLVAFVNGKAVLGLCFQGLHWQNRTAEALSTPAAQFEKWSKRNSSQV